MAGQQNLLNLTQENYYDRFETNLLKQADSYYLIKKFGIGKDIDKDNLRHTQMFYNILCTDECELIDWVSKKITGKLDNIKHKIKLKDPNIYDYYFGQEDSNNITECCDWAKNEW